MVFSNNQLQRIILIPLIVLAIIILNLSLPGISAAADPKTQIGGVTLEFYQSHLDTFTPEEKVYFNAVFNLPGSSAPAESKAPAGVVNYDYYYKAGVAAQNQAQSSGAIGGVTLEFYQSHLDIFTPEEKVYFNAVFKL